MRLDGTCDNLSGHVWLDIYFDKREAVEFELRVRSARSASNSEIDLLMRIMSVELPSRYYWEFPVYAVWTMSRLWDESVRSV
jgi:hypothetical protein